MIAIRKLFGMAVLCLSVSIVDAQDMDRLKNVVPPSPNAASLGKYADWPVSLYTGIPNISVPLYTLKGRSTSVPITLSYHSSGVKVSEIASWVGLGFSLDAGGVITRSVRGLPDDEGGYLKNRLGFTDLNDMTSAVVANPTFDNLKKFEEDLAKGTMDSEPDYFMFNALGRSFKLFFHGEEIVTQPASNVRFEFWFSGNSPGTFTKSPDNSLAYWEVWLEDGTYLLFGKDDDYVERLPGAKYGSSQNGTFSPITAWYLREIRSTFGELVHFSYQDEETEQMVTFSESQRLLIDISGTPHAPEPISRSFSRPKVQSKIISRIWTSMDSAVFLTEPRADLLGGSALQEIVMYSRLDRTCTKKFKFRYEYSESVGGSTYHTGFGYDKRLKLESLTEGDETYSFKKVWSFEYEPQSLPSRASFAQDHWGYFNGAIANKTLLPRNLEYPVSAVYGNREPDTKSMKAEILTAIVYPTGGYSEFEYGQNYAMVTEPQYERDTVEIVGLSSGQFVVNTKMIVKIRFSATLKEFQDFADHVTLIQARITNANGSLATATSAVVVKRQDFGSVSDRQVASGALGLVDKSIDVLLIPGTYNFSITTIDTSLLVAADASLYYDKYLGTYAAPRAVGGLRIERISDYDDETGKVNERTFVYENAFLLRKVRPGDYSRITETRGYTQTASLGFTMETASYYSRYSNNPSPIGTISGGNVGYGKVTTLYGPGGVNGKSVSLFRSESDITSIGSELLPYAPVTDLGWRRGLLIHKSEYDNEGRMLTKDTLEYQFDDVANVRAIKVGYRLTLTSQFFDEEHRSSILAVAPYDIVTEQVKQVKKTSYQYLKQVGTDEVKAMATTTISLYESPLNTQPTRTKTIDSRGDEYTNVTRTVLESSQLVDVSSWVSVVNLMKQRNMVGIPVQVEILKNGVLLKRATTSYKDSLDRILPDVVSIEGPMLPREGRVQFVYDGNGNLVEQMKVNDVRSSYLYDYKSTLPVAQVVNASTGDIAYTGFESEETGRWNVTSNSRVLIEAFTGERSYNLVSGVISIGGLNPANTYVVSLWAKSGAAISINGSATSGDYVNGWTHFTRQITSSTSVTISGSGTIDDLKLRPLNSQMTTYTHGPFGVSSITGPNEITVFYEYDGFGRLSLVLDNKRNILHRYTYNYKLR